MATQSGEVITVEDVAENGKLPGAEHNAGGNKPRQQGGWRGGRGGRPSRFDRKPPREGGMGNDFGPPEKRGPPGGERRFGGDGNGGDGRRPGGFRGRGGRGGGPRGDRGEMGGRTLDDRLMERAMQISGPTFDLAPLDTTEKKFSGRGRLYIGNIAPETTEDEINDLFKQYGETNEFFYNKEKNFGFVRLDYHAHAEKAKNELDGINFKGRTLRVRFAPNGSSIKVKNLTPFVSNELLHYAFGIFGDIERACVIVDDRGKSTGEGIVEFSRKGCAAQAIRKCDELCFFLTSSLRPVIVEQYDIVDDADGFSERTIKRNMEYQRFREVGPRFANVNGYEHEYGMRWKQLYELHAQKEKGLKQELEMEIEKLEAQMEYARYEHETEMLREQLRTREMERERHKRDWEMKEQRVDDMRMRNQDHMRRMNEDMHTEDDARRRQQENSLFMQAHKLDSLLDQQEQTFDTKAVFEAAEPTEGEQPVDSNNSMDPSAFMNQFKRNPRFDGPPPLVGGHWVNEGRGANNRDDFPNKRRRF